MSLIVEKLAAIYRAEFTHRHNRNHAPNHPFSAYIYSLVAVTMFSTILHARSIPA